MNGDTAYIPFTNTFIGGKTFDNKGEFTFDSPEDFLNSCYNRGDDKENRETSGDEYEIAFIVSSTSEQDLKMKESFNNSSQKTYRWYNENCATAVQDALRAAGLLPKETRNSIIPQRAYSKIKKHNPNGREVKKTQH